MVKNTKTKAKTKAKAKTKTTKAKVKAKVVSTPPALTKVETFYINNNPKKTEEELACDLEKPLPVVQQHIYHSKSESRINKLMIRDKGCTIMTEGASMASDEARKGSVSEQSIRNALDRQDYDEAARLQKIFKSQQCEATQQSLDKRITDSIHYVKH